MTEKAWSAVDRYLEETLLPVDTVLDSVLESNRRGGLPPIDVSPLQGRLLTLLAGIAGARRILEIGTLGGYSTICLARALPADGSLVSLEISPVHAEVARRNIDLAALPVPVEVRVGRAAELLVALAAERPIPFDLIFIDADKPGNPTYLDWAIRLSRPGTLIVLDNVVRGGGVIDPAGDASVQGARAGLALMGSDPRLEAATALQTVGSKGYDGFALALVK